MATDSTYQFTTPYPNPKYNYPTAHAKVRSEKKPYRPKGMGRASSPTPSEREEMKESFIDKKFWSWEFYKRPKVIFWIFVLIIICVITALVAIFHKQIEHKLRPAAVWMEKLPAGWLIPIVIMFIISFPPLFGHEIVAILCGNVWGLWIGFAIVVAGTLLGEIGNFYAFRYLFQKTSDDAEKTSWGYACLAKTIREGGFKVAVMARLSAIPGHFTTAIFATCGMNMLVFILATLLSMPKQFITVYLGVLLEESGDPEGTKSTNSKLISNIVLGVTLLVTIFAMWYIWKKMKEVRLDVLRDMRASRLPKYLESGEGTSMLEYSGASIGHRSEGSESQTSTLKGSPRDSFEVEGFDPKSHKVSIEAVPGYREELGMHNPQPQRWESGHMNEIEAGDGRVGRSGSLNLGDYNPYTSYPPHRTAIADSAPSHPPGLSLR